MGVCLASSGELPMCAKMWNPGAGLSVLKLMILDSEHLRVSWRVDPNIHLDSEGANTLIDILVVL